MNAAEILNKLNTLSEIAKNKKSRTLNINAHNGIIEFSAYGCSSNQTKITGFFSAVFDDLTSFKCSIDIQKFITVLKSFNTDIELIYTDSNRSLTFKNSIKEITCRVESFNDLGLNELPTEGTGIPLTSSEIKNILKLSIPHVSAKSIKDYLKGIRFEIHNEINTFATDGHKLINTVHTSNKEWNENCAQDVLLSLEFSKIIFKKDFNKIVICDKYIYTDVNGVKVYCERFDTTQCIKTVNYRKVIPNKPLNGVTLNTKNVIQSINDCLMIEPKNNAIKFITKDNNLCVRSENAMHESVTISLDTYCENISDIEFSGESLKDFIKTINCNEFCFAINDEQKTACLSIPNVNFIVAHLI